MIIAAYAGDYQLHLVAGGVATGACALSRFKGIGSAPPRANRPQRPRTHGADDLTTYYEPRVFELAGRIKAATETAVWAAFDDLKQAMALKGTGPFTLKWKRAGLSYLERADVTVNGDLDHDDNVAGRAPYLNLGWAVTLVAGDPRMYVDTLQTNTFSGAGVTITNGGNFQTQPVIYLTGPGVNPGLRNLSLDSQRDLQANVTLVGGADVITIDVAAQEVYRNGVPTPSALAFPGSFFWALKAGPNALTKLGTAAAITVEWRDARI